MSDFILFFIMRLYLYTFVKDMKSYLTNTGQNKLYIYISKTNIYTKTQVGVVETSLSLQTKS